MRPDALLSCLLFLTAQGTAGEPQEPFYMLLTPAEIHHPFQATVCVLLRGVTEEVQLSVTLRSESRDTKLMDLHTKGPDLQECQHFQVPPPAGGFEEEATVELKVSGDHTAVSETKTVLIKRTKPKGIIQTDKPVYKPDQTVHIRSITMDSDFVASSEKYPLVEILDPHEYCIAQWWDLTPRQGFVEMNFKLPPDPVEGTYLIKVAHLQAIQTFLVVKMVFPKFEVIVTLPQVITLDDDSFHFGVCGRYNHRRPVSGFVSATLCLKAASYYWQEERPADTCQEFQGQTDRSGCLSVKVETKAFPLYSYDYKDSLEARASLVEADTGVTISMTGSCKVSPTIARAVFDISDVGATYTPGMEFRGAVQLLRANGTTLKGEKIYLTIQSGVMEQEKVYFTDDAGRATFTLDTSAWDGDIAYLKAQFRKKSPSHQYGQRNPVYSDGIKALYKLYSLGKSYVKIQPPQEPLLCEQEYPMEVEYSVHAGDILGDSGSLNLYHYVMAKGNIVLHGQTALNISADSVMKGTHYIPLRVTVEIAPLAKMLLVAILANGTLMSDTAEFQVHKCFKNKAQLGFSISQVLPGDGVSLQLQAAPGSLCGVRIVDESVTSVRPEAELSADSVYWLLASSNPVGYPFPVEEWDPPCLRPRFWKRSLPVQTDASGHKILKRFASWGSQPDNQIDVFSRVKLLGLKVITNCAIKKPQDCSGVYPPVMSRDGVGERGEAVNLPHHGPVIGTLDEEEPDDFYATSPANMAEKKDVRRDFQETWFWGLLNLNSTGLAELPLIAPDGIAEYTATMICLADMAFSLSPPKSIKVYKPLSIQLTLPYSVIYGETFSVVANVFNYLEHTIMVQVLQAESSHCDIRSCPDCNYTRCLEAGTGGSFTWLVELKTLGELQLTVSAEALGAEELCDGIKPVVPDKGGTDTAMESVLVQPQGMLVETSHNTMLCAKGNISSDFISIECPPDVVEGTERAVVSVAGDMMGLALGSMDHLLVMPTGCGEQSLSKLAVLVFLREYLERTNQQTESMTQKLRDLITIGTYQQLNYRRSDGSTSPFGDKDDRGNIRLTALFLSILHLSSQSISMDDNIMSEALAWLEEKQLPSGCLQPSGKPFRMEGPDDEIAVTAYVTARLLEVPKLRDLPLVEKALQCLRNTTLEEVTTHTQATLAYIYALCGDEPLLDLMLKKLYGEADSSGVDIFWTQAGREADLWTLPEQGTVEVSAIVLQALLSRQDLTKEDLMKSSQIAGGIMHQQNPYGGYASTLDTMEAFKALSKFAARTSSGCSGINVTLTSHQGFHHVLSVNNSSRLLLQQVKLPSVPGKYDVAVEGEGCVYVQTTLRYHVPPPKTSPSFDLSVEFGPNDFSNTTFAINIQVRYTGTRNTTNMAMIEVGLPSGFSPIVESLNQVENNLLVRRIEQTQLQVNIYMVELTHVQQNITFEMRQDVAVENRKPRMVKVYDFYNPEESATMPY
ncbi:alpha-2-macroglobulin-like protein 1 [Lissotriton helveticus]